MEVITETNTYTVRECVLDLSVLGWQENTLKNCLTTPHALGLISATVKKNKSGFCTFILPSEGDSKPANYLWLLIGGASSLST